MLFDEERTKYKGLLFIGWDYGVPNYSFWDWAEVDEYLKKNYPDAEEDESEDILNEMANDCGGNFSNYIYVEPNNATLKTFKEVVEQMEAMRK